MLIYKVFGGVLFFLGEKLIYDLIVKMFMDKILSLLSMEKLLKKSGAERVSGCAKEVLRDVLEEISVEIGEKSMKLARHSGRKTVKGVDIRLAKK